MIPEDSSSIPAPESTFKSSDSTPMAPVKVDNTLDSSSLASVDTSDSLVTDIAKSKIDELGFKPLDMTNTPLSTLIRSSKLGTRLSPINFSQSILANPAISSTRIGQLSRGSRLGSRLSTEVKLPTGLTASKTR